VEDIYDAAIDWLLDCFPDDEDEILALVDEDLQRAVERHYEGGWAAFEKATI
jgi:hypothetical protein